MSTSPGLLPCAPAPGAAHGHFYPAPGTSPQCHHRAEEAGCRPGGGHHKVGVPAGKG